MNSTIIKIRKSNLSFSLYRQFKDFIYDLFLRMERQKSRKALSELSSEQLKDIGLSPEQVRKELDKGFWD